MIHQSNKAIGYLVKPAFWTKVATAFKISTRVDKTFKMNPLQDFVRHNKVRVPSYELSVTRVTRFSETKSQIFFSSSFDTVFMKKLNESCPALV